MSLGNGEFSFHEMEKRKRKLASSDSFGAQPETNAGYCPSGNPAPMNDPAPQEFFSSDGQTDMESLQLKRAMRMIQRHWKMIFFLMLFLPAVMYVYDEVLSREQIPEAIRSFAAKRRYRSEIGIHRNESATRVELEFTGYNPAAEANLNQVVSRMDFAESIRELVALSSAETAEAIAMKRYINTRASQRRGMASVSVGVIDDGEALIRVEGSERDLLKTVASLAVPEINRHFRKLRQDNFAKKLDDNEKLKSTNLQKLAAAKAELDALDRELRKEGPGEFSGEQRLKKLLDEQFRLKLEKDDLEIRLRHYKKKQNYPQLRKDLKITGDDEIGKALVEGNALRSQWRALDDKLAQIRTHYKDIHPAVQSLTNDIDTIRKSLIAEGNVNSNGELFPLPSPQQEKALSEIAELNDKVQLTALRIEELDAKIRIEEQMRQQWNLKLQQQASSENKDGNKVRSRDMLAEQVRFLQAMALETARKITELRLIENEIGRQGDFEAVGAASGAVQVSPKVALDIFIALIIGLLLGCGMAFLLEGMDNHLHTPSDIYYHLRLNYLGVIPFWSAGESMMIQPEHPDSQIGEVFAHLCNNARYGKVGNPEKRMLIASATPGEGKSTVAANIATRYALEGNSVVLIDADMRRPRGHKLIDIFEDGQALEYGLSSYLGGEADFEQIRYATSTPGLTLIPAGPRVRNAAKLLGAPAMARLLDQAERTFDVVIVDCAAVLPVVDATILAPLVRGVLVIIAADEVEIGAVRMALYRLKHVGAPLVGAVLNKVRERSTSYTYYGYRSHGGYYDPYGRTYGDWEDDENEDDG